MKLIKINTDHYVVVDDSEIKEDCWALHMDPLGGKEIVTANGQCKLDKKITHSSQPLEYDEDNTYTYDKVKYIPPSYIKELIGEKIDLKKIAEERFWKWNGRDWEEHEVTQIEKGQYVSGFVSGYNQSLEDNKEKKYTEAQMRECWRASERFDRPYNEGYAPNFEEFIQSLQPKTQWEVEIVDGKLKLK